MLFWFGYLVSLYMGDEFMKRQHEVLSLHTGSAGAVESCTSALQK